jgi:hypothetical protein
MSAHHFEQRLVWGCPFGGVVPILKFLNDSEQYFE